MKKKIFSVLFALVLVLSLGLVTAVPVSAVEPLDHFTVSPDPLSPTAGEPTTVTITARESGGDPITEFAGENLVLSQTGADEPGNIAWTGDGVIDWHNGAGRFIGDWTEGVCTVNVSYTKANDEVEIAVLGEDSGASGTSEAVTWAGAEADSFTVVTEHSNTETAGEPFKVTLTAMDEYGNTATGYTDDHDISFSSTATASPDDTEPTIPAPEEITFSKGVGGSAENGFILTNALETPTITATETGDGITGTSDPITVVVGELISFTISGEPATVVAGAAFASPDNDITVSAYNGCGNLKTDYIGKVAWSSTDTNGSVELPEDYTFNGGDAGIHTFSGSLFRLFTAGPQTITVSEADSATVSRESSEIEVTPAAPAALSVAADPGEVVANDITTSAITAGIYDEYDNFNSSASADITFTTDLGTFDNGEVSITVATTDGVAIANLKSPSSGTANIGVTSVPEYTPASTTVTFSEWTIDHIELTADPGKIRNNGADVSTITARYLDESNELVTTATGAGYAVTFSITRGDGELSTTDPVNPVDGVAAVTLTADIAVPPAPIMVHAVGYDANTADVFVGVTWNAIEVGLCQGWNLISLPLIPENPNITEVISSDTLGDITHVGIVRGYDPAAKTFPAYQPGVGGELTTMEDGYGYWIFMEAADTLMVYGRVMPIPWQAPPSYPVVEGWNLIGFKSVNAMSAADYEVDAAPGDAFTITATGDYGAYGFIQVITGSVKVTGVGLPVGSPWLCTIASGDEITPPDEEQLWYLSSRGDWVTFTAVEASTLGIYDYEVSENYHATASITADANGNAVLLLGPEERFFSLPDAAVAGGMAPGYLASISGTYPVLWVYHAEGEQYFNVKHVPQGMRVGHGFWLWATEAGTILPPGGTILPPPPPPPLP